MAGSEPINPAESGIEARTWFVRGRNVLAARAELGDLYVDYYLHLGKYDLHPLPEHDALFKRALGVFIPHCASRPWNEHHAWTIHFQEPRVNLFLVADNESGAVTGRIFDEDVKTMDGNYFYADVVRGREPRRRSVVAFAEPDPIAAVEKFYVQSEQRLARCFLLKEEEFLLLTEHPDCDLAWLRGLTREGAAQLEAKETLGQLERRIYRWHCGCNQQRMMEVLAPAMRENPEDLFGGEPKLEIRCPRCAARHVVTREAMESYLANP